MNKANDPLFQPFTLNKLSLKNRIFSAAHEPDFTEDGMPKERYKLYHEEKAKGGLGLSMIGGSTVVSRDSPPTFGNIDASTDRIIPWYEEISEMLHSYDCAVITHMTHLGRRTGWADPDWLPIMASSCLREMAHKQFPKIAEKEDIERITQDYVASCLRAQKGGLDGVEIPVYLQFPGSFMIPNQNNRSDEWGGSLENRLRFSLNLLSQIRQAVGSDYVLGIRVSGGDPDPGGLSSEEATEIMQRYSESGLVDYLNVVYNSTSGSEVSVSRSVPSMGIAASPYIEKIKALRQYVSIPLIHSCRVLDLGTARYAIDSGALDLVGMTRAHMADPHIIAKAQRGEEHRIRPCVGAGHCIDQIYHSGGAYCMHNPATGRESTIPQLIETKSQSIKKALVIGAGPAGLEAARVLAERGHQVKCYEATSTAGGQLSTAALAPRKKDLIGIVDWLLSELCSLGVTIEYGRYMEADDIEKESPDIVIVATGGIPNTEFMQSGSEHVVSTWDVLNRQVKLADNILVYDENGSEPAATCAEFLLEQNKAIDFVTPDRVVGIHMGSTTYPAVLKTFYEKKANVITNHTLLSVSKKSDHLVAHLWHEISNTFIDMSAEQIVVEYGTLPAADVYFDLKPRSKNQGQTNIDALADCKPQPENANPEGNFILHRIGDAVSCRSVHAAIYEARRLCMLY